MAMAMAMINSLHLVVVGTTREETQSRQQEPFLTLSDAVCQFPPAMAWVMYVI